MKKKLLFFDFLFLCLFSFVFACTQPLENQKVMVLDDANVIIENVGPPLIEENVNGEKAGDREEQIENGGKIKGNAILYLTADGKLKIEGRDWKLEENTLTILYDDGACEWLAFRIANKSEDMFEKVIVPSITSIILGDSVQIVLPDSFKDLIN